MEPTQELLQFCISSSDDELFRRLEDQSVGERANLVETLAILGELDVRRAALPRACSSLFIYCTKRLGYCERTAYRRIAAARACRRFPCILDRLRCGKIHLSGIVLLSDHLTPANYEGLLRRAEGATLDELKRLAASESPAEAAPAERTRVIAVISNEASPSTEISRQSELSLEVASKIEIRTEHRFTVSDEAEAKLARARELLSHKFPMGDLESIFDAALEALLDKIDPERRRARARPDGVPRPIEDETRQIPEWVKRKARERDRDQCAYLSSEGVRCGSRHFLQFDHIKPWSLGGRSDEPDNIRQLCANHNRWLARQMI